MTDDITRRQEGLKILHLGRAPKTVTLGETEVVTINDLIDRDLIAPDAAQYYLNGVQVEPDALVKNGDGLVTVDSVTAG